MTPFKNKHPKGGRVRRAVVASKQGSVTAGEYTAAQGPGGGGGGFRP